MIKRMERQMESPQPKKIGKDPEKVFKTLVAQGSSGELYVFIIPVAEELDLKKAAKATGEKKIEMLPVKDITKYTGYIREVVHQLV